MNTVAPIDKASGDCKVAASALAMADLAKERASLLNLLATFFRGKPNREMLSTLRTQELRDALYQAGMVLEEDFFTSDIDLLTETLAVEFTSLFLLPGSLISPHESTQLKGGSGLLRGPETACVREYYEYVGFQVDDSTPMEPDHVSIELEFLSHLNKEESIAWNSGQPERAFDALRYQNEFLEQHLCKWFFDFSQKIEEANISSFYSQIAQLTSAFLSERRTMLPEMIAQLQISYSNS